MKIYSFLITIGDNQSLPFVAVIIPSAIVSLLTGIVCIVVVAIVCWKKRCLQCHTTAIKCADDIQRESSDTTTADTAVSLDVEREAQLEQKVRIITM